MTDEPIEPDFGTLARGMRRTAEKAEREKRAARPPVVEECRATDRWAVTLNPPVEHTEEEST